jgi:uncharacterized protein YigA (DUF484 family)
MSTLKPSASDELKAQQVAAYLSAHPDFFRNHPLVFETLDLPHKTSGAVSLVEKQLAVLRERNTELRTRLNALLETSKTNDALFDKTRALVLRLIAADGASAIFNALHSTITSDFAIAHYSLLVIDKSAQGTSVRTLSSAELHEQLPALKSHNDVICGAFRPQQMEVLFGKAGRNAGSAAAIRFTEDDTQVILALGSADPHRYHSGMDTLFLRFIADVLKLVLLPKI